MTQKTKHTPTPWVLGGQHRDCEFYNQGTNLGFAREEYGKIDSATAKANAAHIVKCVNMHDELVEALKEVHDWFMADDAHPDSMIGRARETLKKAGALARGETQE